MTTTQKPTTKTVRPSAAAIRVFRRMIEDKENAVSRKRYYPPHRIPETCGRTSYLTQAERDAILRTPEIERMEQRLREMEKEREGILARVRELSLMVDNVTIVPSLEHPAERAARAAHESACDEKSEKLDALLVKIDRLVLGVGGFEDLLAELDSI